MPESCYLTDTERTAMIGHLKALAEGVEHLEAMLVEAKSTMERGVVLARSVGLPWEAISEATGLHRQTLWERYRHALADAQRKAVRDVVD